MNRMLANHSRANCTKSSRTPANQEDKTMRSLCCLRAAMIARHYRTKHEKKLITLCMILLQLIQIQANPQSKRQQAVIHRNWNYPQEDTFKLDRIPGRFSIPTDSDANTKHNYLPTGPPPFRPSNLIIGLGSIGAIEKFKHHPMVEKIHGAKIYDTFLDVMRHLSLLADQLAHGKVKLTRTKLDLIQSMIHNVALAGGQSLKMKWPLIMMNPNFLKELLSNPTFLVMVFHAIEVAHASNPMNMWLKPLVKLVRQPSPEKEEQKWWRRKRLYETFNGIGSSELQPNLKTIHFRHPGKPISVAFPQLSGLFRRYYDPKVLEPPKNKNHQSVTEIAHLSNVPMHENQEEWLTNMPPADQLLSKEEFEALEPAEKERIIDEARRGYEESAWTNELIQRQNNLVESLRGKLDSHW